MKDNTFILSKIIWYDIDKDGYINKPLNYEAVVYVYMKIPLKDGKASYYVGSTVKMASRICSHRSHITYLGKYKNTGSPIFYRSVKKHGWFNFKFGVLEYIDLSNITETEQKRKTLLEKEQYYLDSINPSLNVCKIADSPLGVKRNKMFSVNLSKSRKGKKLGIRINNINNISKVITTETKLKISSRCNGVTVKVFDESNNLVYEFPTMTSAAKHFGVHTKTISTIFKTGKSYDNYLYKFEIKDLRVWAYDPNHKLVKILNNAKKASECFNIPSSTMDDYIKSSKLYKNKLYFYNIKSNPYFNN